MIDVKNFIDERLPEQWGEGIKIFKLFHRKEINWNLFIKYTDIAFIKCYSSLMYEIVR